MNFHCCHERNVYVLCFLLAVVMDTECARTN